MPTHRIKGRSILWDYFSKTDIPYDARCNQCHKLISFSGGSTTNLMKHLKRRHLQSVGAKNKQKASRYNVAPVSEEIDIVEEAAQRQRERLKRKLACKTDKKRSIVWNYFSKTDLPFRAQCNRCCHLFSYTGNSLNNLTRHLKRKHSIFLRNKQEVEKCNGLELISEDIKQDYEEPSISQAQSEDEDSTETLGELTTVGEVPEQMLQQPATYYVAEQTDVGIGKEVDKQLMRIITKELHPFNIIDNKEFIAFVNMLNPNFSLPCHKSLSNEMLPKMYLSAVKEVKSALKDVTSVALTTDTWTSINNEDFIAVTAYFLDKSLELQAKLLDCISFQKISSISIAAFLKEVAAFWGLSNKIAAVVTEDIPLLTEAVKECQWQHIPCFALALNRIIKAGLEDINFVITKIRKIVLYLKKTELALTNFSTVKSEIELADIKLKKDSSEGWNSTFEMMTAFLKNKDSLIAAADLLGDDSLKLSQHEWTILECAVKVLIPFNSITTEICSDTVVPLSKVPYMVRFMMRHITSEQQNFPPEVKKMICTMKRELTQLKNLESNDIICQNVLLDPRMKKRGFQQSSFKEAYSSLLERVASLKSEELGKINKERSSAQCKCGTHGSNNNDKQSEYFIDMWSQLRESKITHQLDLTSMATVEIDTFLTEPYINMKENPITFWVNKMNQKKFPTLFELLKSRLCVPATSIPCKNIFSKSGNTWTKKRALMTSGKLREILFFHHNSQ